MSEDKNVYIKDGRRYRPIGYWFENAHEWLTEGVWVVTRRKGSRGTTSGQYLKEMFGIDKVSDLKEVTFAELGDMEKTASEICSLWPSNWYNEPHSMYETVCMTLAKLKELQNNKNNE